MNQFKNLKLIVAIFLILSIGFFSGYSIAYFHAVVSSFPEIKEVAELNPGITTIKFLELSGSKIKGKIEGQKARIAYSPDHIYDLEAGESFELPIYQINLASYYAAADLPVGMQYIASSKGKYFYHVLDPRAFKITPKNRLYFALATEAEIQGFLPAK